MKISKQNLLFFLSKGNLEILKALEKEGPLQFKQLRELVNPSTDKKFSSATIAERLKELDEKGVIQNEPVKKSKRKTLGYAITDNGKKTLKLLKETEEKLEKL